jgi:branched-subunit amino acid aminotransferase/4-amino-4-deoxychorismate lyase
MIVNLNGTFMTGAEARLPITDGAVLFGDTLFETLKAHGTTIRFLQQHLDRIEQACGLLDMPFQRRPVIDALLATAARLSAPCSRLRLTVSRGPFTSLAFPAPELGHFFVTATPYAEPSADERRRGAHCVFAPNRRVNPLSHLPQMKRGNYADCLYAANFARERGAREALFVNAAGEVLEGATSNLFILQGDTLVTPPAGKLVLGGVLRQQVLQAAYALGMATEERNISAEELLAADEAFLSNALIDLLPITSIENHSISQGQVSQALHLRLGVQTE